MGGAKAAVINLAKLEAVEFWTCTEKCAMPGYGQCNPITRFFLDLFPVSGYNKAVQKRVHPTMLVFDIELGFSIFADYSDWKTGNYRPIKRWRPVRSRLFRE